jgi:hypothetical protein
VRQVIRTTRIEFFVRFCLVLGTCCVPVAACRPENDDVTRPATDQSPSDPPATAATGDSASSASQPVSDADATGARSTEEGPEQAIRTDGAARARRAALPVRAGEINDITFDDLELDMAIATLFDRSMLTPRAAQLDGQQVRLRGYIFAGGVFQQTGITSFPFVKNTQCKFGPQGLAYCVILVELDEGATADFTTYPVTVEGTLTVRPFDSDGFTWSVYHLQGRRVY